MILLVYREKYSSFSLSCLNYQIFANRKDFMEFININVGIILVKHIVEGKELKLKTRDVFEVIDAQYN